MRIIEENNFENLLDKSKFNIQNIKDYIYETLPIKPFEEHLEFISELGRDCSISHISKLSNQYILAQNFNSLGIFFVNDLEFILKISTPKIIAYDINKKKNIICLYPHYIKILPEFTNDKIQSFINRPKSQNFISQKELNINPIIEYNIIENFKSILCFDDNNMEQSKNRIICLNKVNNKVDFFDYNLVNKNISLIHSYKCECNFTIYQIKIVKYKNGKILLIFTSSDLLFYDLSKI